MIEIDEVRFIIANIIFFDYVPVAIDDGVAIADGLSNPGDFVDLRTEMDPLVAISINYPTVFDLRGLQFA